MDGEHKSLFSFRNSCRVCLISNEEGMDMIALLTTTYNTNIDSLKICDMFTACTSLELSPTDEYPNLICTNCLADLIAAYELIIKCRKTDEEIRITLDNMSKSHSSIHNNLTLALLIEPIKFVMDVLPTNISISDEISDPIESAEEACPLEMTKNETNDERLKENNSESNYTGATDAASESESNNTPEVLGKVKKRKEFPCLVCGKIFFRNFSLIRHSNVHKSAGISSLSGEKREKRFLCSECGKSFISGGCLQEHLLRHTGLKQFECTECPNRFITKSNHRFKLK